MYRFTISCKNRDYTCWAMALLKNNTRVDGIDWEARVRDHRGHNCSGWHRHLWDRKTGTADNKKQCLENFAPKSVNEFIDQGAALLNIEIREDGNVIENRQLRID